MKKKLIIFGTGELASIAFNSFNLQDKFEIESFTVDKNFIKENSFTNLPVVPFEDIEKNYNSSDYQMHVALSYKELNKMREKKYLEAKNKGYTLASFISKDIYISKNTIFGENCFVLENQTIQDGVEIGDNVVIGGQAGISGHLTIGNNVQIAAKSGVTKNIKDNSVIAGFPAVDIKKWKISNIKLNKL